MKDVLCIYYSRTGNTKKAMEEIAGELGAEVVELRDDTDRTGWRGWLRCGLTRCGRPAARSNLLKRSARWTSTGW